MSRCWTSNCSQTFKTTWIDMKILPQYITRLQGEYNPIKFLLKTSIGWRRYKPPKCSLVNSNWTCKLQMASKNQCILDWSKNFTTQTRRENAVYQQVLLNLDIGCKSTLNCTSRQGGYIWFLQMFRD